MLGIVVHLPESGLFEYTAVLQRYLRLRGKKTFMRTGQNNSLSCSLSLFQAYFQLCFADITDQHFESYCSWALHYCTYSGCFCSVLETKMQASIFFLRKCQMCLKLVSRGYKYVPQPNK